MSADSATIPLFLESIQPNILLKILAKTHWKTLIRLRQTCKGLNQFVENHRGQFSRFPNKDLKLCVSVLADWGLELGVTKHFYTTFKTPDIEDYKVIYNPVYELSGVGFWKLKINDYENDIPDDVILEELLPFLRDLKISPTTVKFMNVSETVAKEVLSMYPSCSAIDVRFWPLIDCHEFKTFCKSEKIKNDDLNITARICDGEGNSIYKEVKDFFGVEVCKVTTERISDFIWEMYTARKEEKTHHKLKSVLFCHVLKDDTELFPHHWTEFRLFCDTSLFPYSRQAAYFDVKIYLAEFRSERMMCIYDRHHDWIVIWILDKLPETLLHDLVLAVFNPTSEKHDVSAFVENFATASFEEQKQIFYDICVNHGEEFYDNPAEFDHLLTVRYLCNKSY